MFKCSNCNICKYLAHQVHLFVYGKRPLKCKHQGDCTTTYMVYLLLCECEGYNVGKTTRHMFMIHLRATQICDLSSPIGRHHAYQHDYKPIRILFTAWDRVHHHPRDGDADKITLQRESFWIHTLRATLPPVMNGMNSFSSFL